MKQLLAAPLLLAGLLLVTACGTSENPGSPDISDDVDFGEDDYTEIISANNKLGFQLLPEVEPDEDGNTFISPTSLMMALSMVYNGAGGATKEEIATSLQIEGIDVSDLNKANASLMAMLAKDSEHIQLNVANSIWLNDAFQFQDNFAENNKNYFNAEIQEIDIMDSESPKMINNWVKKATNEKIEEIVDSPLDTDLVAILINTIYFNGDWTYEFDKKETEDGPFYLEDGSTKDATLMTLHEDELAYMENEQFQAVSLPYGDEEMSMKVFLPKEDVGLEKFKQTLSNKNWESWMSGFQEEEGTVLLPRFQLEYETLLNEQLENLGMKAAFDEDADFSNMIQEDDPVWISQVKQKTFIDVNEEGTEAAAATSVEMKTTSAPIDGPFYMEVNRPFFIAITDDETDAVLFMGSISNPEEGE